jgi:hypothetical protein
MNPLRLTEEGLYNRLCERWETWKNTKKYYTHIVIWWERCVKGQLKEIDFMRLRDGRITEPWKTICMRVSMTSYAATSRRNTTDNISIDIRRNLSAYKQDKCRVTYLTPRRTIA